MMSIKDLKQICPGNGVKLKDGNEETDGHDIKTVKWGVGVRVGVSAPQLESTRCVLVTISLGVT